LVPGAEGKHVGCIAQHSSTLRKGRRCAAAGGGVPVLLATLAGPCSPTRPHAPPNTHPCGFRPALRLHPCSPSIPPAPGPGHILHGPAPPNPSTHLAQHISSIDLPPDHCPPPTWSSTSWLTARRERVSSSCCCDSTSCSSSSWMRRSCGGGGGAAGGRRGTSQSGVGWGGVGWGGVGWGGGKQAGARWREMGRLGHDRHGSSRANSQQQNDGVAFSGSSQARSAEQVP
jgi:hypothetical protein